MLCLDYLHTYYSDDSDYPMEQLIQDAISKGFSEICFTTSSHRYGLSDLTPSREILKLLQLI